MPFPNAPRAPGDALVRRLYTIAGDYEQGFASQARAALALGCELLGVEIGIVARIQGDRYEVIAAVSPDDALPIGATFDLGDTYCALTIESDGPVGFEAAGTTHLATHPAYATFRLEAYLGVPLRVRGAPWGTLNFSSPNVRERRWRPDDVMCLQLMAHWMSGELARRETEAALREALDEVQTLSGLLPICAACKKVRDDDGLWQQVESYIAARTGARFSHGLCPPCAASLYPPPPAAPGP